MLLDLSWPEAFVGMRIDLVVTPMRARSGMADHAHSG
jgi:hypothetical protein